jgi:hypothetical protein
MRHNVARPPREELNTISRESGVQVGALSMIVLSKISRRGSPPAAGIT